MKEMESLYFRVSAPWRKKYDVYIEENISLSLVFAVPWAVGGLEVLT